MCQMGPEFTDVKLTRCQHGCFHLFMGKTTIHMTPAELLAVACEVNRALGVIEPDDGPNASDTPDAPHTPRWSSN
ncbi:hypothetical protein HED60_03505 [Planctomycetales bacterium ZRK34]|nr:hypothetical protein HED60_03505 [Planctomycetales bacterium ZRK34]